MHPPKLTEIKWKSLSDVLDFIFIHKQELFNIIDNNRKSSNEELMLKKINWEELKNAVSVITAFIIKMESYQMKIEFVFGELSKTIQFLQKQNTDISNEMLTELINVYVENKCLNVAVSAFLLTPDGSFFWQNCNSEKKYFFKDIGWRGILLFCKSSNIETKFLFILCF